MADSDAVFDAQLRTLLSDFDLGGVHDQLVSYQRDGELLGETLRRLLDAHPSFIDRECQACGADLTPLDESDWLAWRLRVEDTDDRRTDLYCGPGCLTDSLDGAFEIPITNE